MPQVHVVDLIQKLKQMEKLERAIMALKVQKEVIQDITSQLDMATARLNAIIEEVKIAAGVIDKVNNL